MKRITALSVILLASSAMADVMDYELKWLHDLSDLPLSERQAAAEMYLDHKATYPFITHVKNLATFVYTGPGRDLRLVGDFTDWQPRIAMTHVPGTNLWYHAIRVEPDTRLDYKFIRDDTWILDPRNPLTCMSGFGPNSEVRGWDYAEPPFLSAYTDGAPCRLDTLQVETPRLGGSRQVVVVTPPGADDAERPYLLVHDGLEYISLGRLSMALAWLAAEGGHPLPICVCVPPGRRTEEYATTRQDEFGAFVADTLVPLIEERYGARGPWGTMGASYGGRISLHLAHTYPDKFDRVAAMSPSVSAREHTGVAALAPASLKLYVNWGSYDIQSLIPGCESFVNMLDTKGFNHFVEVKSQGHSWGFWRDSLIPALTYLYGKSP